ncbi:MAG: hypothetical protein QOF71_2397 [Candidatus Eremiobacteraeota bacterium]|jgi:hypothetical protein|nr:hypothetical protein [Candidatus Eremiobacteraeota bacterium]
MRFFTMLGALCFVAGTMPVSAQTAPGPSAPAASAPSATLKYCPLSTRVHDVDDTHTRYAVSMRALETGRASGIVALWAGNRRFDVPFRDVLALDSRDRISPETSFTVRFAAPTTLDGAVVTAIDEGGTLRPCDPWFAPWIPVSRTAPDRRTAEERTTEERFLSRARAATPIDAPAAVADATTCAVPNQSARTVYAVTPDRPRFGGTGLTVVMVLVDPTDKVAGARIQTSSGNRQLDEVALSAARLSEFQGQIFRCRHIMGGYLFSVEFNA